MVAVILLISIVNMFYSLKHKSEFCQKYKKDTERFEDLENCGSFGVCIFVFCGRANFFMWMLAGFVFINRTANVPQEDAFFFFFF